MSVLKLLDPVCDMVVDISSARDQGLTIEMDQEYAFCAQGCLVTFARSPERYIPRVEAWIAAQARPEDTTVRKAVDGTPVIDEGLRRWYASCRCCLSETYPEAAKLLDHEKAEAAGH